MAFKALAAHNWHVRDVQNKGMGGAALHIHIWPYIYTLMAGKWNWSKQTETGSALLSDISHAVGYFISLCP